MLEGKVIVVTGAGSGIGRAAAIYLAGQGARLVLTDIDTAALEAVAITVRQERGEAIVLVGNVTEPTHAEALVACAVERFGQLDGAFNNAGIERPLAHIDEASEADWDATIAVNLKSVWLGMRPQLRQMVLQGNGAIVNTASVGGLLAVPGNAAYAAAKHGVIGLTKTAAVEYADKGIRVNCICPGFTRTPMTDRLIEADPTILTSLMPPVGRMARPEEIAATVSFLLSDAASYISGHAMVVDGAATAL